MNKRKNILLAPLDWGIGHATRCVPIINSLQKKDVNVIIASSGRAASFLQAEFPSLEHVHIPEYGIRYPRKGGMLMQMLRQLPAIQRSINREHRVLDSLIDKYRIEAVISDNRFGMWSSKVVCIYITHQVRVKAPAGLSFIEGILNKMHRKYIRQYDECWIPDILEDGGLSGELAHNSKCPVPSYYIGPQSRFNLPAGPSPEKKYDLMAIISGPEPQRSIFEEIVLKQLKKSPYRALVLLGKPEIRMKPEISGNIEIHAHMHTDAMQEAMLSSDLIICRPGYSGIMDLSLLGCPAVLVPTPGQTEQEYLAAYHQQKHHYYSVSQAKLNISNIVQASRNYPGLKIRHQSDILHERIDKLLSSL
ncbi:MAG: hypothetical protein KAT76_00975 [Bacteroidales bacterium]|nr:hypothetical protein [Bacteroidales bacterium]